MVVKKSPCLYIYGLMVCLLVFPVVDGFLMHLDHFHASVLRTNWEWCGVKPVAVGIFNLLGGAGLLSV